jgi:hypothetical protein
MLVYAEDAILLGGNIDTIKKNKQAFNDAIKDVDLEVNVEKARRCILANRPVVS